MRETYINANIQIVAQLSNIYVWEEKKMNNGTEKQKNMLSYIDFTRLCSVIKKFPELNHNFVKESFTCPLPIF